MMVSLKKYPSTSKQWQLQEENAEKQIKKKKDRKENHPHTASLKGGGAGL